MLLITYNKTCCSISQQRDVPSQPLLSSGVNPVPERASSEPVSTDLVEDDVAYGTGHGLSEVSVIVDAQECIEEQVAAVVEDYDDNAGELATPEEEGQSMDNESVSPESNLVPAVRCGDLHEVVQFKVTSGRELVDHEKHYLLNHHFVPTATYQFPAHTFGKQHRRFQRSWLTRYKGLTYSKSADGGYCKFCVLFAQVEVSGQQLGVLVNRPFTNLKHASEILNGHFSRKSHLLAVQKAKAFSNVMANKAMSIEQQVNSQVAKTIAENRLKLRSIAATVIFCGHQAIALRGHRDDWSTIDDDSVDSRSGNFHALLQFRIDAGDCVLKEHLHTASKNAIYTSKTIQNDMVSVCGKLIRNKILCKVKQARFFSIIADEATDASNTEQLSISVRFVDKDGALCE